MTLFSRLFLGPTQPIFLVSLVAEARVMRDSAQSCLLDLSRNLVSQSSDGRDYTTVRGPSPSGVRHRRRRVAGSNRTDKAVDGWRRGRTWSVESETIYNPNHLRLLLNCSKCTT